MSSVAPLIKPIPDMYAHQVVTRDFIAKNPAIFNLSDPGTGKTRSCLEAIQDHYATLSGKDRKQFKVLIVAPLSIMEAAWADDIKKFTPNLKFSLCYAKNRDKSLAADATIYLINHDAVKHMAKHNLSEGFNWLIVDESTAFKTHNAQRSVALRTIARDFEKVILLTGTPNPLSVTDLWNQVHILDGGKRLGKQFYSYRNRYCHPEPVMGTPGAKIWRDKPGAEANVFSLIDDISIRYRAEDCIDLPPNMEQIKYVRLPQAQMDAYQELARNSILQTKGRLVNAVHKGALVKKLLQLCSGNVYDEGKQSVHISSSRTELCVDLCEQRPDPVVVAYNWRHERDAIQAVCKKRKITTAYIDGSISPAQRAEIVRDFQKGKIQLLALQPQAAAHGITLTRGKTTIWHSPTYNSEQYVQLNKRIHRAGQTSKTETIKIAAYGTAEESVYAKLEGKKSKMEDLLELFAINTRNQH